MAGEMRAGVSGGVPELRETRVDVDERLAVKAIEYRRQRQVSTDVDQQLGIGRERENLAARQAAMRGASACVDQRARAGKAEPLGDRFEVCQVCARFNRASVACFIAANVRRNLLEEEDAVAQPLQPSGPA